MLSACTNAAAIAAQTRLARLRLLGYAGVQFNALLVPILVFQLTGNATLAGMALFIEWLPKLAFYIGGGALVRKFSPVKAHTRLDASRLAALTILALCATGLGSVWLVALAAAVYQCANAVSNILFERAVTNWWDPSQRAGGHARLLQQDQWGCVLALAVGLVVQDPLLLASLALIIQATAFAEVLRHRDSIYPLKGTELPAPSNFWRQLRKDVVVVTKLPIIQFSVMTVCLSLPSALVFSALVFFLAQAESSMVTPTGWLSFLLLVRTGLSLVTLQWVRSLLKKPNNEEWLARLGVGLVLTCTVLLSLQLPLWGVILVVTILGASGSLYLPWLRTTRQELITQLVPESSRLGATGVLIAVEAASYLLAAVLLAAFGENLPLTTRVTAVICAIGVAILIMFGWREREPQP